MKIALQQLAARHPAARPGTTALRGISLQLEAGEQVAVIGPSGAGKSTLLQLLACALPPSAGTLQLQGQNPWQLAKRELRALRRQLFLAPQAPPLPPRQRVVTSVLAGRLPAMSLWASLRSLLYPSDNPAAWQALDQLELADKLFERVDRLSGGERQRVALARAWLAPARLWLLDEPLSALDPARAERVLAALQRRAQEQQLTLVASLHHVELALQHFPRIIGLRAGELCFDLPAQQVDAQRLAQLYAQAEHELQTPAPLTWAEAEPASPALMHCR